jgi:hypothetical protein
MIHGATGAHGAQQAQLAAGTQAHKAARQQPEQALKLLEMPASEKAEAPASHPTKGLNLDLSA